MFSSHRADRSAKLEHGDGLVPRQASSGEGATALGRSEASDRPRLDGRTGAIASGAFDAGVAGVFLVDHSGRPRPPLTSSGDVGLVGKEATLGAGLAKGEALGSGECFAFALAELVQVGVPIVPVLRVVHLDVPAFAVLRRDLLVLGVAALEDVDLRKVQSRVVGHVHVPVVFAEELGTVQHAP